MLTKRSDDKTLTDKKSCLRRLVWIVSSLILVMLVILIIATVWLVPGVIRKEVERGLSRFCEGPVEIDIFKVNYSGRLYLEGIKFFDKAKRQWLYAEKVNATFANWPSFNPVITEVEINGLSLQVSVVDEKFILPLAHPTQRSSGPNNRFDLSKLTIKEVAITITDAQGSENVYDNIMFSAIRSDSVYDILLSRLISESSETLLTEGTFNNQNLNFDISLEVKHQFSKTEMSLLFTAMNMREVSAEGHLVADLTITGYLNDLLGIQSSGIVYFNECVLFINDKVLAKNLATVAKLDGHSLKIDKFSGLVCNGPVSGSLFIEAKQNQPMEFRGRFLAQRMSFVELTSILGGHGREATKGSVTLNYNFTAKGSDLENLSGDGQILLDDADISVIPVIPFLFNAMGLAQLDTLKMSDAECTFSMAGPVVTITNAHIANPLAAIEAEPGGTINFQTGDLDMYVMAVPLRQIETLARRIPFADIVFNLKDRLTRFYIRGHWSSPPTELVTKTPIKDITEGTIGFLQDVVQNGGQFGQEMLKGFRALFPVKENKNE